VVMRQQDQIEPPGVVITMRLVGSITSGAVGPMWVDETSGYDDDSCQPED